MVSFLATIILGLNTMAYANGAKVQCVENLTRSQLHFEMPRMEPGDSLVDAVFLSNFQREFARHGIDARLVRFYPSRNGIRGMTLVTPNDPRLPASFRNLVFHLKNRESRAG